MAVDVPEQYGGLETGQSHLGVGLRSDRGLGKLLGQLQRAHGDWHAAGGLVWDGSAKEKYLRKLATGEWIAAYALSESSSGSDAMNIRAQARLSPDGKQYILNGEKMWISNAGFADLFIVFAKIDGEQFSAFLVERDTPGLTIGAEEHKLGIRGSSTCPLVLSDCVIPVENLLGEAGKGHHIAFNILNVGRYKLGAATLGGARSTLRNALRYGKQRMAFGKPITSFGLIQEKIADIAAGIFAGEALVYRVVGAIDAALATLAPDASGERSAEAHRGVRGRVLDREGVVLGDAGAGGRPLRPDLWRLRLR